MIFVPQVAHSDNLWEPQDRLWLVDARSASASLRYPLCRCVRDNAEMKPLRCLLHLHVWHNYHNDEGERYQLCTRCRAYREIYILTDYRAGSA